MDKHLDAEALSDYAEGLADAGARAAADAHLSGCAQCRRELSAVQAYFRDMADLEPARAPADFLARVHARLPRPSFWERAWAALLLPFRVVPAPIAVAVLLGVTAITVYVLQGGLESRTLAPAPAEPPSAPVMSLPGLKDNRPAKLASAPPKPSSYRARHKNPESALAQESLEEKPPAQPKPREVAQNRADASPSASPAPAPAREPAAGAAGAPPAYPESQAWADRPASADVLNNSSEPSTLPLDKAPREEDGSAPRKAEAATGRAAAKRMEKKKAAAPGYAVSLKAQADTAALLGGLRSMGIVAVPESAAPGESDFRLSLPAAMLGELGPYLARHGESRLEGPLPSAAPGSALSIRLRLLFPAP